MDYSTEQAHEHEHEQARAKTRLETGDAAQQVRQGTIVVSASKLGVVRLMNAGVCWAETAHARFALRTDKINVGAKRKRSLTRSLSAVRIVIIDDGDGESERARAVLDVNPIAFHGPSDMTRYQLPLCRLEGDTVPLSVAEDCAISCCCDVDLRHVAMYETLLRRGRESTLSFTVTKSQIKNKNIFGLYKRWFIATDYIYSTNLLLLLLS